MRKKVYGALVMALMCMVSLFNQTYAVEPNEVDSKAVNSDTPYIVMGNNEINILNGGRMLTAGDVYYYVESGVIWRADKSGSGEVIKTVDAAFLNQLGEDLIYVVSGPDGDWIEKMDPVTLDTETLLAWDGDGIQMLYTLSDDTICFLSNDVVYTLYSESTEPEPVEDASGAVSFVPTEQGIIYATGEALDYTLLVNDTKIMEGVTSYYVEEDYLIVTAEGEDYQIRLDDLFSSAFDEESIEDFSLHGTVDVEDLFLSHSEECETCQNNMRAYLNSQADEANGTAEQVPLKSSAAVSTGQANIVRRALQQHNILWTPLQDVVQWGEMGYFQAGVTYAGLPYGQPVSTGTGTSSGHSFVCYDVSFSQFLTAVNTNGSMFYTKTSTYNQVAPIYSNDCSTFVSYAWGLSNRNTTGSLGGHATKVSDQSIYSAQVGDILNLSSDHVVLISAVEYDTDGNIIAIETLEQTPPMTTHTRYGEGGDYTLTHMQNKFFNDGYILYRSNTRDSVTYTHDHSVYIDGDSCPICEASNNGIPSDSPIPFMDVQEGAWYYDYVVYVYENGIFNGMSSNTFAPDDNITRGQFVYALANMHGADSSGYIPSTGTGTVSGTDVNMRSGPGTSYSIVGTYSHISVTVISTEQSTSGETWYKVSYNGQEGYIRSDFISFTGTYTDVESGKYYYGAVEWATAQGVISGVGGGRFEPENSITREDIATILYRYAGATGVTLLENETAMNFSDAESIGNYAKAAVDALQRSGIISGYSDNTFLPKASAQRSHVAKIFAEFHVQYLA